MKIKVELSNKATAGCIMHVEQPHLHMHISSGSGKVLMAALSDRGLLPLDAKHAAFASRRSAAPGDAAGSTCQ